jgi:2-amino-4-hydroxy-6-hydroxymethyldihydropteridine diphosphokinase
MLDSHPGIEVVARSSVYVTEPVGEVAEQRDFYNAALRVRTALEPLELLAACKGVERELGRLPDARRHGPRPIDVDLLLVGDLTLGDDALRLPHPELTARRFVLVPLVELDPALELPDGTRLDRSLAGLGSDQRVERVGALEPAR